MMYRFGAGLACFAMLACFTMFVGTGLSGEKGKSPDEQVKELIAKYNALPEKEKAASKGDDIIKQLKAVTGKLSPQSQEEVSRRLPHWRSASRAICPRSRTSRRSRSASPRSKA